MFSVSSVVKRYLIYRILLRSLSLEIFPERLPINLASLNKGHLSSAMILTGISHGFKNVRIKSCGMSGSAFCTVKSVPLTLIPEFLS